jgi:hypothetical protein
MRLCLHSFPCSSTHILGFDLDTVKMLMNIFDTDRSGSIGFNGESYA